MKEKQKVDFSVAMILLFIGIILTFLPLILNIKINIITLILFISYAIINLVQYILTRKNKDYEGLFTFFISLATAILTIIFDVNKSPNTLAMIMMFWVTLMSLIKFKKVDYYHDRRDRMWKLRIFTLFLFIIAGISTSVNLAHTSSVQTIIIGFFMIIHGMLELFDPVVKTLISHA